VITLRFRALPGDFRRVSWPIVQPGAAVPHVSFWLGYSMLYQGYPTPDCARGKLLAKKPAVCDLASYRPGIRPSFLAHQPQNQRRKKN